MPILTVRIDSEMMEKIEELARIKGKSKSSLLREIIEGVIREQMDSEVREACMAMRMGKKPVGKVDWSAIELELSRTEPAFSTPEEAISYTRRRPHIEKETENSD